MGILLIIIFSMLYSLQMVMKKKYTKMTLDIASSKNIYLAISSGIAMVYYFIMSKGDIRTNGITLLYALVFAVIVFLSVVIGLAAIEKTNIINISVFSGAGSIIIPFLFGYFFYKEKVSLGKGLAVVLLTFVVLLPLLNAKGKMKNSLSGYLYCLLLFLIEGCTTIIYKLYGADARTMSETTFCFWTNVILLPFTILIALKVSGYKQLKEDVKRMEKSVWIIALVMILSANVSTLISIQALKMVNIIVYTILKNAFTMLSTILFARILMKEKLDMKEWLSIVISITAVILNSF